MGSVMVCGPVGEDAGGVAPPRWVPSPDLSVHSIVWFKTSDNIDYWDAAEGFYGRLPVIGSILRRIAKRLAI